MRRIIRRIRRDWQYLRALATINSLKRKANGHLDEPSKLVSLVCQFDGSILRPYQIEEELANLVRDVRKLKPMNVLEIGTAQGGTLFLWARLAQQNATIVSIDLPGGKFGGGYSERQERLYRRFAGTNQKLHLLRLDSHADSTFEETKKLFGGSPIDLLFIDADHTYEGVKRDWEMYSPLVRPGGIVAFHDVAGNYDDTHVKRFWDSIKDGLRYQEYVVNPDGQYGIGVLFR